MPALQGQIARKADRLEAVSKLFDSLNYKSVLKRGFALVRDADGQPLRSAEAVLDGQALVLEFADGKTDATGGRIGIAAQAREAEARRRRKSRVLYSSGIENGVVHPYVKSDDRTADGLDDHRMAAAAAKPCNARSLARSAAEAVAAQYLDSNPSRRR